MYYYLTVNVDHHSSECEELKKNYVLVISLHESTQAYLRLFFLLFLSYHLLISSILRQVCSCIFYPVISLILFVSLVWNQLKQCKYHLILVDNSFLVGKNSIITVVNSCYYYLCNRFAWISLLFYVNLLIFMSWIIR